jgi:hypothetical protein
MAITISNNNNSNVDETSTEENQYLLHAESSERLLGIMQQISSIADSQQAAEELSFTEEDMTNLIESVEELLFYAELMTLKVPANQLEESNNVIFSAMASKLYNEALNIQQLTKSYDLQATDYSQDHLLNEAFTRLSQTCNACHQLFRDR